MDTSELSGSFRITIFLSLLAYLTLGAMSARAMSLDEVRELAAQERYATALAGLEDLLKADPDNADAKLFRGVVLTKQGRTEEAILSFRELTESHPDLPEPRNNLAVLYASQSRYEEARAALLEAVRISPGYDTAQENLGDIYAKLAAQAYKRAYELNASNTRARDKSLSMTQTLQPGGEPQSETTSAQAPPAEPPAAAPEPPVPAPQPVGAVAGAAATGRIVREPDPEAADNRAKSKLEITSAETASVGAESKPEKQISCFQIGDFTQESAIMSAAAWLDDQGAVVQTTSADDKEPLTYKVYLPPFPSREEAIIQMRIMKDQGISDVGLLPRGDLKNGLALGVYSSDAAAERRAEELRTRGYPAQFAPRILPNRSYRLEVTVAVERPLDEDAFKNSFPNRNIESVSCG